MAGRHAAGQTTRRTPLIREITRLKPGKGGRTPPYRAKHALRRTRRPVTPLVAATAITVTVVSAAVGLAAQADPEAAKAGDLEQATQPTKLPTAQPVLRAQTRPAPRPSSTGTGARKVRTVVIRTAHKTWKSGMYLRVTDPRNGKSVVARVHNRNTRGSGQCHDRSQET